jgi:hypothetical protein
VLSNTVVEYLSSRPYRAEAERRSCFLPYCGICWDDELPERWCFQELSEADLHSIFRLFALRLELWRGEVLVDADRRFWDEARRQVPMFALFQRLVISDEDRLAQDEFERSVTSELQAVLATADEVDIVPNEHGGVDFSVKFSLKDDAPPAETRSRRRRWWPFRWPFGE